MLEHGAMARLMLQFISLKACAITNTLFRGFNFYLESRVIETGLKLLIANAI